jgi:hypothetical protein
MGNNATKGQEHKLKKVTIEILRTVNGENRRITDRSLFITKFHHSLQLNAELI